MPLVTFPPMAARRDGVPAASASGQPQPAPCDRVLPRFLVLQCAVCGAWRVLDTLLGAQVGDWAKTHAEAVSPISALLDRWMVLVSEQGVQP